MVGSIKYSEFVFLLNSNLVGSVFTFSKFINPVSGGFLLGVNSGLLGLGKGSSFSGNSLLSSFGVRGNSSSGGLSL